MEKESFICPLTQEIMKDPVVDPEGNTYERSAIEEWLKKNSTSPITRNPLRAKDLIPNRALKNAIEESGAAPAKEKEEKAEVKAPEDNQKKANAIIKVSTQPNKEANEVDVLVSIVPPEQSERTPSDICCVIDVSGSMATQATVKNEKGVEEAHGLSLLDIVKHATRTIIHSLGPNDRLAIVAFHTTASKIFPLTPMNEASKKLCLAKLDELQPLDSTNIWDGLQLGLELLKEGQASPNIKSLFLLTDGQPNVSPPRGEVQMLQRYKDQNKQLSCTINTFGFGYGINSELLQGLSIEGEGSYAFIPDASFVGTIFVHSTSNMLVTWAHNVQLSLEPLNGASISEVYGNLASQAASWGQLVSLGSMQAGQPRDVVVRVKVPKDSDVAKPYLSAVLKFDAYKAPKSEVSVEIAERPQNSNPEIVFQISRAKAVAALLSVLENFRGKDDPSSKEVENAINKIKKGKSTDPRTKALLQDLEGQGIEATKKNFWKKWGQHYYPSLARAHQIQQCNNFKDPGVQHYGGQLFKKTRDEIDDIFVKLPPPTPSKKAQASYSSYNSAAAVSTPVKSMQTYHNRRNGCFGGESLIKMADGELKQIQNVRKGDLVMSDNGKISKILCVVSYRGASQLIKLEGGLLITGYHPVRINGSWRFPVDISDNVVDNTVNNVWNLVLEDNHIVIVNGVECVTLGHNFQEDVVRHPYFGSQLVVQDLKKSNGWEQGFVTFDARAVIREATTGLVSGIEINVVA